MWAHILHTNLFNYANNQGSGCAIFFRNIQFVFCRAISCAIYILKIEDSLKHSKHGTPKDLNETAHL